MALSQILINSIDTTHIKYSDKIDLKLFEAFLKEEEPAEQFIYMTIT
jgi:hypothetical protein